MIFPFYRGGATVNRDARQLGPAPSIVIEGVSADVPVRMIQDGYSALGTPVYLITALNFVNDSDFTYEFRALNDEAVKFLFNLPPRTTGTRALVPVTEQFLTHGQFDVTLRV